MKDDFVYTYTVVAYYLRFVWYPVHTKINREKIISYSKWLYSCTFIYGTYSKNILQSRCLDKFKYRIPRRGWFKYNRLLPIMLNYLFFYVGCLFYVIKFCINGKVSPQGATVTCKSFIYYTTYVWILRAVR